MSTLNSILSSIGGQSRPLQQPSPSQAPNPDPNRPPVTKTGDSRGPTPKNTAAGVKRKSEEPEDLPRPKTARLGERSDGEANKSGAAASSGGGGGGMSRFQLSTKPGLPPKATAAAAATVPHRPSAAPASSTNTQRVVPKPTLNWNGGGVMAGKPAAPAAPTPVAAKRGFASIMEKAKAAQEAANAAGTSTIKHRAAEKMTMRERRRMVEDAKAQEKTTKVGEAARRDASKGGAAGSDSPKKGQESGHKGATRAPPQPLAYKGTMRSAGAGDGKEAKRKGDARERQNNYVDWSDLDDAEDEEEDYDSEGSSDMEGGFDDVEREELFATRAARKEDQEALEEEEQHRREKLERKRKLMELSQSAKARKRY